jgi:xanthine dehydrogenase accessory factor
MVLALNPVFPGEFLVNENEYLAKTVHGQLAAGSPLVLVSIMSMQGSTPRHSGTKMVVGADGKTYGTIGGSLMEAQAIKEAKVVLSTRKSGILTYELSGKDAAAPGMICGGRAEILLDYLPASRENIEFSFNWQEAIQQGKDFYILTHLKGDGGSFNVPGHAILYGDNTLAGTGSLKPTDVGKLKPELHNISSTAVLPLDDTRAMVDRIRKLKTLYCFGGGHVAVPTASLAALVGFRVVVIDDRDEYASPERFPEASKTIVARDFNRAFEGLEIDGDSFIVIVTRGHQYDRECLEQALKTNAGYIGMISSRRKKEAIFSALMSAGVKQEQLEKVHSPIGIDIGGETPEEIAISIIAELISVRSKQSS